jgi:hypothetical protein
VNLWLYNNHADFYVLLYLEGAHVASAQPHSRSFPAFDATGEENLEAFEWAGTGLNTKPVPGSLANSGLVKSLCYIHEPST